MPEPEVKAKVEFTTEQQEHINTIFNTRFAKISEQKEQEKKALEDKIAALETAVAAKAKETAKEGSAAADATKDEEARKQTLDLLNAEKQQTKAAKDAFETERAARVRAEEQNAHILKNQAIRDAASHMDTIEFYDLGLVTELVKELVVFDKDSNRFVVKENGVVKQNSSLEPMTLTEYFQAFAVQRPYLVKGVAKGGSGSSDSDRHSSQFDAGLIHTKADLNKGTQSQRIKAKSDYITKFGLEAFTALPLK